MFAGTAGLAGSTLATRHGAAAVTDESENGPSAEYKLTMAALMIEASRAFSSFDDA
jgi:hypothetical protein